MEFANTVFSNKLCSAIFDHHFFARINICWSRIFLWNKTFVNATLKLGMFFSVQGSLYSQQKPTVLKCRPYVEFFEMRTFQEEKCCKKLGKMDFRHHFMLPHKPKFLVISQTNWFSEKFRKVRLCCLVQTSFLSFYPSSDRTQSFEILAFIYFRTSLTFRNFGQQLLTFFKKNET